MNRTLTIYINKRVVFQIIAIAILSVFTVIVSGIIKDNGHLSYTIPGFILRAGFMFVFFAVMWIVPSFLNKIPDLELFNLCKWEKKSIILTSIVLFVIRIPYLIAYYPGISNHDCIDQLGDFFNGMDASGVFLYDHHPVFDTLVFGGFVSIGNPIHNLNVGFFIYALVQMVFCCIGFALLLGYMDKLGFPRIYMLIGLIYYAFVYFIALYEMSMIKDAFSGVFFIFYYLVYTALCTEKEENNKKLWIILILLSLFLALTKKVAMYQVILYSAGLLICGGVRKKLGYVIASAIIPFIVISVLLQGVVFPATHVKSGGADSQLEIYGLLFHQVAKYSLDYPDEVSEEDKELIDKIIVYDSIPENFDFNTIDPIKGIFRGEELSRENLSDFMKLYFKYFIRHPYSFISSFFGINGFYFSPKSRIGVFSLVMENNMGIKNPESLEPFRNTIMYFWDKIALNGKNLLLNMVFYVFWIPVISLLRTVYYKDNRGIAALIPLIVNILFLSICPVALDRYAIPQFYAFPVALAIGGCTYRQRM